MKAFKHKKTVIALIALSIMAVSKGVYADTTIDYEIKDTVNVVDTNKQWKIKFNRELDSSTVNSSNIIVQDDGNSTIYNSVTLDTDNKTIILTPSSTYTQGKKYKVIIKKDVKAKDGKLLRKPIKMEFTIKNVYSGLPYEEGLIILRDTAYSIDYLAKNATLKNEILNDSYNIYYCYEPTKQKILEVLGNVDINGSNQPTKYYTMTYIDANGEKSKYTWNSTLAEYQLVVPAVYAEVTSNSSAKLVTVKATTVEGIDGAVYFKMENTIDEKPLGQTVVYTSKNPLETLSILDINKNVIATAKINTYYPGNYKRTLTKTGTELRGNTTGNISNNGYAVEDSDNFIYYNNTGDKNQLYKQDPNGVLNKLISADNAQYLNVLGDYIYYSNYADKGKLYRIKKDGTGREKFLDDLAAYVTISKDTIYYSNHSDGGRLYSVKADKSNIITDANGENHGRIVSNSIKDEVAYINVSGDYIYFTNISDRHRPYIINKDGTYKSKLSDEWADSIQIQGDWIYYTTNSGELSKVSKDGSSSVVPIMGQSKQIDKGYHLNVSGDWIYYSNNKDSGKLYKISTDGTGITQKLSDDSVGYINIVGDFIYYTSKGNLYRLPITADGKIKAEQIKKPGADQKVISMDDLTVVVPYTEVNQTLKWLEDKYLPDKVPGIMEDNTMKQFVIAWDRVNVDIKNGVRIYTGDVVGYSKQILLYFQIPSEMLNESNTITVYNNPDKGADVIVVENLYDNNLITTPQKLNVGDIVTVYDKETGGNLLSKAAVTRVGKYNKAIVQKMDLDMYGQQSIWITVTRAGKSESKPTEVKQTDATTVVKASDKDDVGLGIDGRDFTITEWVPSQTNNPKAYSIYVLPSKTKLDLSQSTFSSLSALGSSDSTWTGLRTYKMDSKAQTYKGGKYDIFIATEYDGYGSYDNRGARPVVKGYISSNPYTLDITEELLPAKPTLDKQVYKRGDLITLKNAPAAGEIAWLIPLDRQATFDGWKAEDAVGVTDGLSWQPFTLTELNNGVATKLVGDGKTKTMAVPSGMDAADPAYKDVQYRLVIVNKVGASPLSDYTITVDNKAPTISILDPAVGSSGYYEIHPENKIKMKILNEDADVYIVRVTDDCNTLEKLQNAVKTNGARVKSLKQGITIDYDLKGMKARTDNIVPNYKIQAVDKAGNVSNIADELRVILYVDINKVSVLLTEAKKAMIAVYDDGVSKLLDFQKNKLQPVIQSTDDAVLQAEDLTQRDIDNLADNLERTMIEVGVPSPFKDDPMSKVTVETNGLCLVDINNFYVPAGEKITDNLKLRTKGRFDETVEIYWESSNEQVISTILSPGKVIRQVDKDITVTLTATIKKADKSMKKSFSVIVRGINMKPVIKLVNDLKDYFDETDIQIAFGKSYEEDKVKEYKVMIVPETSLVPGEYKANSFDLAGAKIVAAKSPLENKYMTVAKDGSLQYLFRLTAGTKDVNGNAIVAGTNYRVFILAVGDPTQIDAQEKDSLSDASGSITITPIP
ncbi:hypothetical protein CLHOM_07340 [Clostridium homopropionicum DSM 5847]|uniref:DUF5050 domain-containing protein n=1 Tax=Clostridium homopropionicum DSM 5847 TaxID=1121318 RepID=A0A0L6ZCB4_9CLOT|nr:DUF5050 domain-containing protein [Clostridium homopropionicum]KOA20592.1 hypothetical protein CLHOM_07340 [Clostridium homopropionicum DSM 5847]SFF93643.1 Ig-like domain-containing protein [Clostridium homopropionicum]